MSENMLDLSRIVNPDRVGKVGLCKCGQVLIFQLYMQDQQWLCMKCGKTYPSPPRDQQTTPLLEAKWRALESEFMSTCGAKLIVKGMYREGCEICDTDTETHIGHATDFEWRQCNDAIKWLSDRTGREFGLVNGVLMGMDGK